MVRQKRKSNFHFWTWKKLFLNWFCFRVSQNCKQKSPKINQFSLKETNFLRLAFAFEFASWKMSKIQTATKSKHKTEKKFRIREVQKFDFFLIFFSKFFFPFSCKRETQKQRANFWKNAAIASRFLMEKRFLRSSLLFAILWFCFVLFCFARKSFDFGSKSKLKSLKIVQLNVGNFFSPQSRQQIAKFALLLHCNLLVEKTRIALFKLAISRRANFALFARKNNNETLHCFARNCLLFANNNKGRRKTNSPRHAPARVARAPARVALFG